MANNENLNPIKKGEIRNPNGRPKGSKNRSTVVKELLETILHKQNPIDEFDERKEFTAEEMIVAKHIRQAMEGDVQSAKLILDSAYGTPKQTVENTIIDVTPPEIRFIDNEEE
tara:strand:+ start:289 stop:627 length:339 start_codon:yes stop_codon:yes gene_type:complete